MCVYVCVRVCMSVFDVCLSVWERTSCCFTTVCNRPAEAELPGILQLLHFNYTWRYCYYISTLPYLGLHGFQEFTLWSSWFCDWQLYTLSHPPCSREASLTVLTVSPYNVQHNSICLTMVDTLFQYLEKTGH